MRMLVRGLAWLQFSYCVPSILVHGAIGVSSAPTVLADEPRIQLPDGQHLKLERIFLDYWYGTRGRDLQIVSPGDRSREFSRIRIAFDTRPIEQRGSTDQNTQIDRIVNQILPATAAKWEHHLMVEPVVGSIPVRQSSCGGRFQNALQGDVEFEADLVVVVSGEDCPPELAGAQAYATPCAFDQLDRPVIGLITFCLNSRSLSPTGQAEQYTGFSIQGQFSSWTGTTFRPQHVSGDSLLFRITLHELAHALGMVSPLYYLFRDERGRPLSTRERRSGLCYDGSDQDDFFPDDTIVQLVPKGNGTRGFDQYLVTPRVRQMVRNHFDCQSVLGARLAEDPGCRGTHWHEREYYNHLLSPVVSGSYTDESISLLTLALFEDSGWYRVNYDGGSHPPFGLLAGCAFVDEDCIQNGTTPDWNQGEFCDAPLIQRRGGGISIDSLRFVLCDSSHESWSVCDLVSRRAGDLPEQNYFADPTLGALFTGADGCPTSSIGLGLNCKIDDPYTPFYQGESVGLESRCINAKFGDEVISFQPACLKVVCDVNARRVRIISADGTEYVCDSDGQEIEIPLVQGGTGFLICPRLATLCPELFMCRNGCHGRGVCVRTGTSQDPSCANCTEGDETNDCSPPYASAFATTAPAAPITTRPTTPPTTQTLNPTEDPHMLSTQSPQSTSVQEPAASGQQMSQGLRWILSVGTLYLSVY